MNILWNLRRPLLVKSNRANGKRSGDTYGDDCSDDDLLDTSVLVGVRWPKVGLVGCRRPPALVLRSIAIPRVLVTGLGADTRLPPGLGDRHFLVILAIPMQSHVLVLRSTSKRPDHVVVRHLLLLLGILTEL